MIEVYKIFSGNYDDLVTSWLTGRHFESSYDLRGNARAFGQMPRVW